MLNAWNEVHVVHVSDHSGTHQWIDVNHDGKIQTSTDRFIPEKGGAYRYEYAYESFNRLNWSLSTFTWLLLALCAVLARDFFYILRIRLLTHHQLNWKSGLYTIMIWEFASALAPGVISGSAVAMFILNREKIPLGRATAIVFCTAFLDNLFYVVLVPIVLASLYYLGITIDFFSSTTVLTVFWIAYAVFTGVAVFFFLILFVQPYIGRAVFQFLGNLRVFNRWKHQLVQIGEDSTNASLALKKETKWFWIRAFGYTCFSWLSRYVVINALIQAFIPLNIFGHVSLFSKQLVLWLIMRVSPTPGGSGFAEYAFTELMGGYGGSLLLITFIAILWRMLTYFPYLFIGAFLLPKWLVRTQKG
jgi:uncharacterized protein (TIRG00374 family)